jgi:hypothetical protein
VSEQQERLTTLQLSEAETRRQLDIALAELSATRNSAAGAESAASEAVGLRRALAEAERQMNGAGAELSELSRQLAEAKGQRDASQVRVDPCLFPLSLQSFEQCVSLLLCPFCQVQMLGMRSRVGSI